MGVFDTGLIKNPLDSSLSTRVIRGSLWILALRLSNRILNLLRILILARLLEPEHFGLIGIAGLSIVLIETFTQPGLATALIRDKGDARPYLDTVWVVSFLRSACIFILVFVSAPHVAQFFTAPEARDVIRVLSFSVLIVGVRNPAILYFQKELDFKKQYIYEFSSTLVKLIVSAVAAVVLMNVWALVIGGMAGSVMNLVMSYRLHPYRPRFKLEKEKFQKLFRFGRWIWSSSILWFLVSQGDDLVLGKVFGVVMLGLYQMAYSLSDMPTTQLGEVIGRVTFPAYSKIQDDKERLRRAYMKVLLFVGIASLAFSGGIFLLAREFTSLVLSSKWSGIVPFLYILVWSGLLKAIAATTEPVFDALGKPVAHTKYLFLQLIALIVAIYPLVQAFGVIGVAVAVLVSQFLSTFFAVVLLLRALDIGAGPFLRTLAAPFLSMMIMISTGYFVKQMIDTSQVFFFFCLIALCAVVYTLSVTVIGRVLGFKIIHEARETMRSLKK